MPHSAVRRRRRGSERRRGRREERQEKEGEGYGEGRGRGGEEEEEEDVRGRRRKRGESRYTSSRERSVTPRTHGVLFWRGDEGGGEGEQEELAHTRVEDNDSRNIHAQLQ